MSKLLSRARVYYEHALTVDYKKINKDDVYLDSCCFHLQQSIEFILKGIVEMHGMQYAENHDIRANLNILNRAGISIPYEKELRDKAEVLYRWETETRYKDSFIAAIKDIEEVMEIFINLITYVEKDLSVRTAVEKPFPDTRVR